MDKDGVKFSGCHLLIEFWGVGFLDDAPFVSSTLEKAAKKAGAKLLKTEKHIFSSGGVTCFVLLEESHISIHTWPEKSLALIDIFMCGNCLPYEALDTLKQAFTPEKVVVSEHKRGVEV